MIRPTSASREVRRGSQMGWRGIFYMVQTSAVLSLMVGGPCICDCQDATVPSLPTPPPSR